MLAGHIFRTQLSTYTSPHTLAIVWTSDVRLFAVRALTYDSKTSLHSPAVVELAGTVETDRLSSFIVSLATVPSYFMRQRPS